MDAVKFLQERNRYESVGGRICAYGVCVDCVVPEDFFCQYGERRASDGE